MVQLLCLTPIDFTSPEMTPESSMKSQDMPREQQQPQPLLHRQQQTVMTGQLVRWPEVQTVNFRFPTILAVERELLRAISLVFPRVIPPLLLATVDSPEMDSSLVVGVVTTALGLWLVVDRLPSLLLMWSARQFGLRW